MFSRIKSMNAKNNPLFLSIDAFGRNSNRAIINICITRQNSMYNTSAHVPKAPLPNDLPVERVQSKNGSRFCGKDDDLVKKSVLAKIKILNKINI